MATCKETMRDLGLSYEEALHGVQTAIKFRLDNEPQTDPQRSFAGPKHLRTGVDMRAADARGLAALLIDKGVFTLAEFTEYVRLAANEELADYEDRARKLFGNPGLHFR